MRILALSIIGLTFCSMAGSVYAAGSHEGHDHSNHAEHATDDKMDHAAMGHGTDGHAMMHDKPLEMDGATAPTVRISVTKDPMAGYNLHVMVERLKFAPLSASKAHVEGEGHAHVYANGVKLARLYGAWMHLDKLPKGDVEISVSLNTNDHRPFHADGIPVEAVQMITVE